MVLAGEPREWEVVPYLLDRTPRERRCEALISIGRIVSEEPGMRACASWIRTLAPGLASRRCRWATPIGRPRHDRAGHRRPHRSGLRARHHLAHRDRRHVQGRRSRNAGCRDCDDRDGDLRRPEACGTGQPQLRHHPRADVLQPSGSGRRPSRRMPPTRPSSGSSRRTASSSGGFTIMRMRSVRSAGRGLGAGARRWTSYASPTEPRIYVLPPTTLGALAADVTRKLEDGDPEVRRSRDESVPRRARPPATACPR